MRLMPLFCWSCKQVRSQRKWSQRIAASASPAQCYVDIAGLRLVAPLLLHGRKLRAAPKHNRLKLRPMSSATATIEGRKREAARRVSRPIGTVAITALWLARGAYSFQETPEN